ncbi:MAG: hypothetical protein ACXAC8_13410 [Candidatus Hodarchaeales archaeon]|jgi:hypothetical protein
MTQDGLSNMDISILEIISQHRDIHLLSIMAQIKQMTTITAQIFNKNQFMENIERLERLGHIRRLPSNDQTFCLTQTGKDLI